MFGWIGVVSHHLRSLLDVIALTVLCAFIFKVGYFDAKIREIFVQLRSLTYLHVWGNVTKYLHGIKL